MPTILKILSVPAAALALMSLVGTAEARSRNCGGDEALSTLAGAVIGGVIGGQFGNDGDDRAVGAIAGALLGGAVGASAADDCGSSYGGYDDRYGYDAYYEDDYSYDDGRYYGAYAGERYDDGYYYDTFESADPYQRVSWRDDRYGYAGYVEPQDWYEDDYGRDCRAFSQTIYIDGRRQQASGTACRAPDGTWQIVD
ncbi:MAG: glycine zipper 2TM domain-containing protein [Alphaproteobacteria bacterium]|nr:glycine zipper 2TM domain-containing protein [Alphaproteobacteria bacterium]